MNDVRVETDIMMYLSTDDIKRLGKSFHGQELSLQEFVVALRELLAEHITDQVHKQVITYIIIICIIFIRLNLQPNALIYLKQ